MSAQQKQAGHYATVNGLKMYYEIYGKGMPLVLIHGGGSTIQSNWGRMIPGLSKTHQVIAVELQAHGRTKDIDRTYTFEQNADDVAELLKQLHITKADIMGFSHGGTAALQMAIRHPEMVNKIIIASAPFKRDGMQPGFFEMMDHASLSNMPQPLKDAFSKANGGDSTGLQAMFDRDVVRTKSFVDISDSLIKNIQAPALVLNADKDVVRTEHALELSRTLP
ncbi:MAG: alpha/beta hydrolase, partial [Chitinophagaceae bacterium]